VVAFWFASLLAAFLAGRALRLRSERKGDAMPRAAIRDIGRHLVEGEKP